MTSPALIDTPVSAKQRVSIHFSRLIAREVGANEKSLNTLLRETGISPTEFLNDEIMLTTEQQVAITMNAMALSGDEELGLRVGKLLSPEIYGPMGFLVSLSPNLEIAIKHFERLLPNWTPFAQLRTTFDKQWMICDIIMHHTENSVMYRGAIESFSLSLLSILNSIVGKDLGDTMLQCRYPPPSYVDQYKRYYDVRVEFNQPASRLLIPSELAAAINPVASKANYSLAIKLSQNMLDNLPNQKNSIKSRVQQVLLSAPPGALNQIDVARYLFISERTLARRLATEDTGFRQVRDEILANIAAKHLQETDETIDAIALLLNFQDSSNFRRAFKKWFGITPREFRLKARYLS